MPVPGVKITSGSRVTGVRRWRRRRLLGQIHQEHRLLFRRILDLTGELAIAACGRSMEPAVPHGRIVSILPSGGRPSSGEVILFLGPAGSFVLHRVVIRLGRISVCSGDGERHYQFVTGNRILGLMKGPNEGTPVRRPGPRAGGPSQGSLSGIPRCSTGTGCIGGGGASRTWPACG